MNDMKWTTEFPKESGFYWIRNYHVIGRTESLSRSEATVAYLVRSGESLSFWLFQWPDIFSQCDIMQAEWQGPIQPQD